MNTPARTRWTNSPTATAKFDEECDADKSRFFAGIAAMEVGVHKLTAHAESSCPGGKA